jgi:N-acetyl sugar amidotransferase
MTSAATIASAQEQEIKTVEKDGKIFAVHPQDGLLEVKYGLPVKVVFCRKCVISNQRPSSASEFGHTAQSKKHTIEFVDGVCSACRYAERKDKEIDWEKRERDLVTLLDKYRSRNGSYDCLVPGSGGKDSIFASHLLKTKFGMHPLTVTWAPHLYTDVGWRNFQGWVHKAGFDNYLFTPNGEIHRKLTQFAYRNLLHPFQPFILGQKNYAPRMAARFGIPLVFYGESEAEYGNPVGENDSAQRRAEYYSRLSGSNADIYLGGESLAKLESHGIEPGQLDPYLPANVDELQKVGVDVQYLGYYIKWTPQECYYYSVEHAGFEANTERTEGTYSKYNSIDDKTDGYHYWTTFIKFGIGRATYDAAQEIRNHHITRDEGVALVRRFDGELPRKFLPEFLDYLAMDEAEFLEIADKFRSPHLWKQVGGQWQRRYIVS